MSAAVSRVQFSLDLEPTLTDKFRKFRHVLAASVYGCRIGLAGVAAHCDLSPSALSRMLNENEEDPRNMDVEYVPKILQATKDYTPIFWLVATFLPDETMRQRAAISQLESLMPQIHAALAVLPKGKK